MTGRSSTLCKEGRSMANTFDGSAIKRLKLLITVVDKT